MIISNKIPNTDVRKMGINLIFVKVSLKVKKIDYSEESP